MYDGTKKKNGEILDVFRQEKIAYEERSTASLLDHYSNYSTTGRDESSTIAGNSTDYSMIMNIHEVVHIRKESEQR